MPANNELSDGNALNQLRRLEVKNRQATRKAKKIEESRRGKRLETNSCVSEPEAPASQRPISAETPPNETLAEALCNAESNRCAARRDPCLPKLKFNQSFALCSAYENRHRTSHKKKPSRTSNTYISIIQTSADLSENPFTPRYFIYYLIFVKQNLHLLISGDCFIVIFF